MKKLLTILILLLAVASQGWAIDAITNVYPNVIMGNYANYIVIESSVVSEFVAGDVITVNVCDVNDGAMFELNSVDGDTWSRLQKDETTILGTIGSIEGSSFSINLTSDMITALSGKKLAIKGKDYTLQSVILTKQSDSSNSTLYPIILPIVGWGYKEIQPVSFSQASVNDVIVAEFESNISNEVALQFTYGWSEVQTYSINGKYARITISDNNVLTKLKDNSLIISPRSSESVTLKEVKLVPTYQVSVAATNGTIYIGDTETEYINNTRYEAGSSVSLRAVANDGYRFVNWTNESSEVVSTDATFTTASITGALTLTANFIQQFTVTAASADTNKGTVAITNADASNKYDAGSNVTVTASPLEGFIFDKWTKDGDTEWSSTSNPQTIENLAADWTLTASFKDAKILDWSHEYEVSKDLFSSVETGGKVKINFTFTNGESNGSLQIVHRTAGGEVGTIYQRQQRKLPLLVIP